MSCKFPIGKDDTKVFGYGFCIGTGEIGRKFRRNLGRAKLDEHVGGIEGL